MARKITVRYENGSEETFLAKPKTIIAAERHLGKSISEHLAEFQFILGWKASKSRVKFEDWLDEVDVVTEFEDKDDEADEEGDAGADPTSAPSPDESLT